jgi:hypothetical protein
MSLVADVGLQQSHDTSSTDTDSNLVSPLF